MNNLPEPSSPILDEIMGILTDNNKDPEIEYKQYLIKKYLKISYFSLIP